MYSYEILGSASETFTCVPSDSSYLPLNVTSVAAFALYASPIATSDVKIRFFLIFLSLFYLIK